MAKPSTLSLVLLLSILYITTTTTTLAATPRRTTATTAASAVAEANFVKSSCSSTTYPAKCVQSLLVYAPAIKRSPAQLAQTALTVSLSSAQSTRTFVHRLTKFRGLKPREMAAIKDCFQEIDDTVDRLANSIKEMQVAGSTRREFDWHISNVQTWVSAALTDENTCADGFAGRALNGRMKSSIKARIVDVAQITSNALALVNKYASKA